MPKRNGTRERQAERGIIITAPHYPLATQTGIKHMPTVKPCMNCTLCLYADECATLVHDHNGYALCEHLMSYELYPPDVERAVRARRDVPIHVNVNRRNP